MGILLMKGEKCGANVVSVALGRTKGVCRFDIP